MISNSFLLRKRHRSRGACVRVRPRVCVGDLACARSGPPFLFSENGGPSLRATPVAFHGVLWDLGLGGEGTDSDVSPPSPWDPGVSQAPAGPVRVPRKPSTWKRVRCLSGGPQAPEATASCVSPRAERCGQRACLSFPLLLEASSFLPSRFCEPVHALPSRGQPAAGFCT